MATALPSLVGERFVDRQEETSLVEERIRMIQSGGSVFQAVINFYGVVGIGKTFLLMELERRVRKRELPCTLVDLAETGTEAASLSAAQVGLLEKAALGFGDLRQFFSFEDIDDFEREEPSDEQVRKRVQVFLASLKRVVKEHGAPAVLFFDTLDQANKELVDWVEEAIIGPLLRTDQALVIVASRAPHRWKRFEVRRRAQQERLEPFDAKTTRAQLPSEYGPLASEIVHLTRGHPFGNVKVVKSVQGIEQEEGHALKSTQFEHYQRRLIQELVDNLVEDVVMEDVSPEICRAYRVVALARHFDVNVLRRLLTTFVKDPFADKSAAYFLGVVGKMVKTTLVEWSSARRGYMLDQTIRWMLALNMKLNAEDRYKRIQWELIELYDDWIERVPENRSGFIIERLYHEACLRSVRGESAQEIADQLSELLKECLSQYYAIAQGTREVPLGLTMLKEGLDKDDDLERLLTPKHLDALVQMIEQVVVRDYQ